MSNNANGEQATRRREAIVSMCVGAVLSPVLIVLGFLFPEWALLIPLGIAVAFFTEAYGVTELLKTRRQDQPLTTQQTVLVGVGAGMGLLAVLAVVAFLAVLAVGAFILLIFATSG